VTTQEEAPAQKPVSKIPFACDVCPYSPLYWNAYSMPSNITEVLIFGLYPLMN
jgi:hypothetical protein